MVTTKRVEHSAGAMRAARIIFGLVRDFIPSVPAETEAVIADTISRETGDTEMLEALKEFVRVMESSKTTASMPATVAQAKQAIQKADLEV